MPVKKHLIILTLVNLLVVNSFGLTVSAQERGDFSTNAISKLNKFLTRNIAEKAYLQFDMPCYIAGDTIYFKVYLTLGERHMPSNLSGVLHVDLINPDNRIDQSIILQVKDGVTWGDFSLPDSLPKGNYRVRAYTKWMRNDGEDAFFDRIIPVYAAAAEKVPESSPSRPAKLYNKPAIVFLPESGVLASGVLTKIAFKAIAAHSLGIAVKGSIVDGAGREVCAFASTHLGMGYFYIDPEPGKLYKAMVSYPDGLKDTVDLPNASENAITLSVNNDSIPKATVKITANAAYFSENKSKKYNLVIYSGGAATTVTFPLDSALVTIDILKRRLSTGVASATLFASTGEPLCERLFFVQNYDQLKLGLSPDKTTYTKREKTVINLQVNDWAGRPVAGHFSVSVTDEDKVPANDDNGNGILSYMSLTSNLQGNIEEPNYYFNDTSVNASKALDVLMLTQGYRRFEWKRLLSDNYPPAAYLPEKNLEISGELKTVDGKPVSKGLVSLVALQGGAIAKQVTDVNGNFDFLTDGVRDSDRFVISALYANGKNKTRITYNRYGEVPVVMAPRGACRAGDTSQTFNRYLESRAQDAQMNIAALGRQRMLKEVHVKARKIEKIVGDPKYGFPDQVINGDQLHYGGQLVTQLFGKVFHVTFVRVENPTPHYLPVINRPGVKPMLVIWNGSPLESDFDLNEIRPDEIKTIEAFTNPTVSDPSHDGVLIVTTTYGSKPGGTTSTGVLPIYVTGFYKAREFDSPKYNVASPAAATIDSRSTVYWNPQLAVGADGKASFYFYNTDERGSYRLIIEGIDEKGNIGRQVYHYQVN